MHKALFYVARLSYVDTTFPPTVSRLHPTSQLCFPCSRQPVFALSVWQKISKKYQVLWYRNRCYPSSHDQEPSFRVKATRYYQSYSSQRFRCIIKRIASLFTIAACLKTSRHCSISLVLDWYNLKVRLYVEDIQSGDSQQPKPSINTIIVMYHEHTTQTPATSAALANYHKLHSDRRLGSYSATVAAESAGAAFWKDCLMDARLSDISRMFSRVTGRSVDAA